MAAVDASNRSTERRSTAPAAPKLRDSCHGCAASKLKCSKEKPTCARCAKRGMVCEYFATKRAGRKQKNPRPNIANAAQPLPLPASWSASSATDLMASPDLMQHSLTQHTSAYSDLLPGLLSPSDLTSASTLTNLDTQFDDFFTSSICFPLLDTPDTDSLTGSGNNSHGPNSLLDPSDAASLLNFEHAFSVLDETTSDLRSLSKPQTPSNSRLSDACELPYSHDLRSEHPCSCLIRALGLLRQLFPNGSMGCTTSSALSHENSLGQYSTIQSMITENEQVIEAISKMLQCPCSQDGYLLAIISLIVFKVLAWYATAARKTLGPDGHQVSNKSPHSHQTIDSSVVMGGYCVDGEDQSRLAAQLVLGELHRVQRLVNVLSQRLKCHRLRNGGVGTPESSFDDGSDLFLDGGSAFPFSTTMLDQLELDLRKRLHTLSSEIVDILRRG